ncbi:hypothetical protein KEM56_003732 [Ascosphaera pollenicola]|nr:hypothetical protein KEM56_003732 [Ascosphaera pollenicola]
MADVVRRLPVPQHAWARGSVIGACHVVKENSTVEEASKGDSDDKDGEPEDKDSEED